MPMSIHSSSSLWSRGGALILALTCLHGSAQAPEPRQQFDIASGPLADVLLQIGRTAGVLVSFHPSLVRGHQAPAVRGAFTVAEAVALVTQPNGLVAKAAEGGTWTVTAAPPAPPPAETAQTPTARPAPGPEPVVVLPRVEVLGSGRRQEDGLKALRGSSATRTDTLLVDLPQSVSVLTGEALDLQGGVTSIDAMRYVTSVSSRLDIAGGQGMVPSLLVRGLPALYAVSGMGTVRASMPVDNAFIERIEVPKGPSSLITGVGSFGGRGGVVNLVRKEAGGERNPEWVQTGSSQDGGTVRLQADMGGRASRALAWRLVAFGDGTGTTDGGYDHRGGAGVLTSLRYGSDDFSATLNLQADRRRLTPAALSKGGVPQPDGTISPLEPGRIDPLNPEDRMLAGAADVELGLEWRVAPRWRANLKTRVEAAVNDLRHLVPVQRRISSWNTAFQGGLVGDIATGPVQHQLLLGWDVSRWRLRLVDTPLVPGTFVLPRSDTRELKTELLLQDQLRFGRLRGRLAVQSARVPVYGGDPSQPDRRALNWDAGLLYRLSPEASVYAGGQHSTETDLLRAIGEAIFFGGAGEPTVTRQAQAGLKLDLLSDRLALTLEAFGIDQTNVPTVGFENGLIFSLTPRRWVQGLEFELAGRPVAAWELQLGMSFMRATDQLAGVDGGAGMAVDGAGIPPRSMHILSRWHLPQRWWPQTSVGLALRSRATTPSLTPNQNAPGLQVLLPSSTDLRLSLERRFGAWTVNAFVRNAADRAIYETQAAPGLIPLEPGRSFGLIATWRGSGMAARGE